MKVWIVALITFGVWAASDQLPTSCQMTAETESGTVCGRKRNATNGDVYASFRGMRYAKAPRRELRFAEPQKPDPYDGIFDAREAGPICPQVDVIYGRILKPRSMSEDCLRINVHVPLDSLPDPEGGSKELLPVFVFVHGGSFSYGSGDSDLHGPEYLMAGKGVVFVTFNYRLNVFGFLSLYSNEIPGNAGLRDVLFALKWVQNNIANFGGDPAQVTLGGQSAGGAIAHIMSISPAVKDQGLFKRVIALSGLANAGFWSTSAIYTTNLNIMFFLAAGLNILQKPHELHQKLIEMPVKKLLEANRFVLGITGLLTFGPILETPQPGFTTILPLDPETLISDGYGKEYPIWIGFCNNEAQSFKKRLVEVNIESNFRLAPPLTIPLNIVWASSLLTIPEMTKMHMNEYFNNTLIRLDKFLNAATDGYYKYPAIRLAERRLRVDAEPTYMSQFSYYSNNGFKVWNDLGNWTGAAHLEDITYFFRVNSILGKMRRNELEEDNDDSRMKMLMTDHVTQFVKTGSPVPQNLESKWPPTSEILSFQDIVSPDRYNFQPLTPYLKQKKQYFDALNNIGREQLWRR